MDQSIQERATQLFQNAEILAPMVRASSTPLRTLALSYGCDLTYTEENVDCSITSTERIFNEDLNTIDYRKKMDSFSSKVKRRKTNESYTEPFTDIAKIIAHSNLIKQSYSRSR